VEAVHRQAIGGSFGRDLVSGCDGALGGSNDGLALRLRVSAIVIVEEDGSQRPAHMPFETIGEHAQKHMGANTVGEAMVDRPDQDIDGLDRAEGTLDVGEAFVRADACSNLR
jgi:hypothetical protein